MVISEFYNMYQNFCVNVEQKTLDEFKSICIDNDISYSDMAILLMEFVIRKNSVTDNLICYLKEE